MKGSPFLDLFAARRREAPERAFARFDGAPITFAELGRDADGLAAALRRRGLVAGDRIAVMLRNGKAALALAFGMAEAGLVWVPVNVQQRGPGLAYILEHCAPRLVVAEADLVATLRECGAALPDLLSAEDLPSLLAETADFTEPPPPPEACFAICYTSGTTGPPKGVMVTHRMLRFAGEGVALVSAARDGDVMLMWEPLYHIGGMQMLMLPLIREVSLAMVPRFSAGRFWQEARRYGASHIHYLGGILQILLKQPPGPLDRAHGVRVAWGGGCPADIWRPFEERFGIPIRECYGMTEASSITTYNDDGTVGAVGKPVPWLAVALGEEAGGTGEIVVRERQAGALFPGYFRNPEASAKALREGALHTGDLGSIDERGNLRFRGRLGDSLRRRGENISAWEIERLVASHPAVEDCAVIGVPAEIGEEEVKLLVQVRTGESLDPAVLSAWLSQRLAAFQNPRYIALVEGFARTPSQRIMKHLLPRDTGGCWDREASRPR